MYWGGARMLEGAALLLKAYSLIILTVLLIKMLLMSTKKESQSTGIAGFVMLFPIFLLIANMVI